MKFFCDLKRKKFSKFFLLTNMNRLFPEHFRSLTFLNVVVYFIFWSLSNARFATKGDVFDFLYVKNEILEC